MLYNCVIVVIVNLKRKKEKEKKRQNAQRRKTSWFKCLSLFPREISVSMSLCHFSKAAD